MSDALRAAALDALWPLPHVIPGPYFITQEEIDRANAKVLKLRAWVDSAQELSEREREAYRGWLDFCERDNRRAQESLDTNERQRFEERWDKRMAERAEQIRRVKIPRPPKL